MPSNQNPEQIARDHIDKLLQQAGWAVQNKNQIDLHSGLGQAVREYQTDTGPADYILFVDGKPVGVIEAKAESLGHKLTTVEEQTAEYAAAKLKWVNSQGPLPFLYESTGAITRFTDARDPKPRSREVFSFHRPETLKEWLDQGCSLRHRLQSLPHLNPQGLRECQEIAINNLEDSFKHNRPRALIQMATGSGKTYTAITAMYRLLKFGEAKRILFLVDTRNLGEQAEQEMMSYLPNDDNRKFTELYSVQRLQSSYVAKDSQVCISTIQRLYSILKGEELDSSLEDINPAEQLTKPKQPMPVVYNDKVPLEFFDFIFIDECHRSIYNVWQQVLDYFDSFLIGLTATPDNRTYGFFKKNVVSEYTHEKAVADGVNVGNEIYLIETHISQSGGKIPAKLQIQKREKLTRKKRWEQQDQDETYTNKELDNSVVNPDQIRTVIRAYQQNWQTMFPGRQEVPKTLIFAKTDSHADDIIQTVREEFAEGNAFCKKVTYKADEDPKSTLADFRNAYHPRIAVTVDMIATGTDVKPLECLLFMRDVRSRNYFEQMKGRGTRTLDMDGLKKVTPSAQTGKTHYVIVDAVGVTTSLKTASQPLITKPGVSLKDLAMGVMMGAHDSDAVSSLAGRLARLNQQLDANDHKQIQQQSGGISLSQLVGALFNAIDPDAVSQKACELAGLPADADPSEQQYQQAQAQLVKEAAKVLNGPLIEVLDNIRRDKEQTIDHHNLDHLTFAGWSAEAAEHASSLAQQFADFLASHQDQIEALSIFYSQPHRRREISNAMIHQILALLKANQPKLAPLHVWQAYSQLDNYQGKQPVSELTALIALIRRVCGLDKQLTHFEDIVRRNFQTWIMQHHAGNPNKFTEEQLAWLQMIRDRIAVSYHIDRDDLELAPFDGQGGLSKMYQLFGAEMDTILDELNEALAA
ncbi:DEAD/DEAH box helicase family protein [Methylomonas sp. DH-1]|uniref:type I restriction endonuclease subunit R n=1 Tax=Methylomonas sp. (strain DH-1) TaxID=1727196 RepID=UPI0007C8F7B3|nr:DEAD/DEAH box helicase family protein [Methylomonas sp. DH-1]ANE54115.1 restriction endonuclease subunit R [Methylomonas sp. DH-1]